MVSDAELQCAVVYRLCQGEGSTLPTILACCEEFQDFLRFARAGAKVIRNIPPGNAPETDDAKVAGFRVVQSSDHHQLVYGVDQYGLCYCVISGDWYPPRIAILCLIELASQFSPKFGSYAAHASEFFFTRHSREMFQELSAKYKDPTNLDKVTKALHTAKRAKDKMEDNFDKLRSQMANQFQALMSKSERLEDMASVFRRKLKQPVKKASLVPSNHIVPTAMAEEEDSHSGDEESSLATSTTMENSTSTFDDSNMSCHDSTISFHSNGAPGDESQLSLEGLPNNDNNNNCARINEDSDSLSSIEYGKNSDGSLREQESIGDEYEERWFHPTQPNKHGACASDELDRQKWQPLEKERPTARSYCNSNDDEKNTSCLVRGGARVQNPGIDRGMNEEKEAEERQILDRDTNDSSSDASYGPTEWQEGSPAVPNDDSTSLCNSAVAMSLDGDANFDGGASIDFGQVHDVSSHYLGDDKSFGSYTFIPFDPVPQLFPYHVPSGSSVHWQHRFSGSTIATKRTEQAMLDVSVGSESQRTNLSSMIEWVALEAQLRGIQAQTPSSACPQRIEIDVQSTTQTLESGQFNTPVSISLNQYEYLLRRLNELSEDNQMLRQSYMTMEEKCSNLMYASSARDQSKDASSEERRKTSEGSQGRHSSRPGRIASGSSSGTSRSGRRQSHVRSEKRKSSSVRTMRKIPELECDADELLDVSEVGHQAATTLQCFWRMIIAKKRAGRRRRRVDSHGSHGSRSKKKSRSHIPGSTSSNGSRRSRSSRNSSDRQSSRRANDDRRKESRSKTERSGRCRSDKDRKPSTSKPISRTESPMSLE